MADRDYTIVAPDGREMTITGPDNASPQQLRMAAMAAFARAPKAEAPKPEASTLQKTSDAVNAFGTGGNRGLLRLVGLPVDTVLNAWDLGKAGVGTAYTMATGKAAPSALDPSNRREYIGSSDYLIDRAGKTNAGDFLINPQNPEFEGGYLQAAGSGLTNIANPASKVQAINQAMLGVSGAVAGKAAGDASGNEALGVTAGMLPLLAQTAATGAGKRAIRGGEKGRLAMAQRIQDLKNAGIEEPTLGLASGNATIGGLENLLQNTPGAVNVMRNAREKALSGMEAKALGAAEMSSGNRGSLEAGAGIVKGLQGKKEAFKGRQGELYNVLDQHVPAGTPSGVNSTVKTLADLNADIPGAPNTSKLFKNARISGIEDAILADLTQPKAYSPSQLRDAIAQNPDGPNALGALLGEGKLPYEAVKKTRTLVGNEIADASLLSDVPRSKWNPLYGALSSDLQDIAAQSGPKATAAFNRANDYTRSGLQRMERVAPFADVTAPEQAFTNLQRTLNENVSTFQAVKKSLPEGVRGQVAGTVIERLGKANPSNQNDLGTTWSPETFLTNWNKMSEKGRNELFSGYENAAQAKKDVEAVAKATSMMRDNSKLWANPSGTGANLFARSALLAGAGSGLIDPWLPVAAGTTIGGANLLSRALTNPGVVRAVSERNTISPQMQQGLIQQLLAQDLEAQKNK